MTDPRPAEGPDREALLRVVEAALTDAEDFLLLSKIGSPHMQSVSNERAAAVAVVDALRRAALLPSPLAPGGAQRAVPASAGLPLPDPMQPVPVEVSWSTGKDDPTPKPHPLRGVFGVTAATADASPPAPGGPGRLVSADDCTTPGHPDAEHWCVTITKDWPPPAPGGGDTDLRAEAIAADLLGTDALTPNHDGTPEHYIVDAENVAYLVRTVLALAARPDADRDALARVRALLDDHEPWSGEQAEFVSDLRAALSGDTTEGQPGGAG